MLTSCIPDDLASITPLPAEWNVSLNYLLPSGNSKSDADPWDNVRRNYAIDSVHSGKSNGHDDPWTRIRESYDVDSVHSKLRAVTGEGRGVPGEQGAHLSDVLFVSQEIERVGSDLLTVVEVRGSIARLTSGMGMDVFAVNVPASWILGVEVEVTHEHISNRKQLPLLGYCEWRIIRNY